MQCVEQDGLIKPFTRDTFGIAVKATYGEIGEQPLMIFKNPKTDTGNFKKSQRGLCRVYHDENGAIIYADNYDKNTMVPGEENLLECVFNNGKMVKEYSLFDIRKHLHGGEF